MAAPAPPPPSVKKPAAAAAPPSGKALLYKAMNYNDKTCTISPDVAELRSLVGKVGFDKALLNQLHFRDDSRLLAWTALHACCGGSAYSNKEDAMVVLVEAGADLSVKSAQGDTALHMLVLNSHSASAVARFLKAAGDRVDGSMPNANGETALELAVRYKIWHLIPALLAPPYYDPKWRNKQGDSLLSLAVGAGAPKSIVDLLERAEPATPARATSPASATVTVDLDMLRLLLRVSQRHAVQEEDEEARRVMLKTIYNLQKKYGV